MRLWPEARLELNTLAMISPFLFTNLEARWSPLAYKLDSSNTGFGIVETEVSKEELRAEARFGPLPSWPIADVERVYSLGEQDAWAPED